MRYLITVLLAFMVLAVGTAAAKDPERPRCESCGMYWDASPTRLEITVKLADGKTMAHRFESFVCVHPGFAAAYDEMPEVASFKVLDYTSFGSKNEAFLDGWKAVYLYGTTAIKGSMAPYIAAFASEAAAKHAQETLGGELVDYAEIHERLMAEEKQAAGSGAGSGVYVCPCSGDCCTDIQASEPGTCPKCGMELVLKQ